MVVFSIIVPVYQAERYLPKCIDSVIKQTFGDFELLLLNDGSIDKSIDICNEYARHDSRIRVFSQENHGQAFTRNKGIEFANGQYIIFLDSDDWLDLNALNLIHNCIKEDKSDVVLYKYCFVDDSQKYTKIKMNFPQQCVTGKKALKMLFEQKLRSYVSLACSKNIMQGIRFPVGRVYEDTGTIYKILGGAATVSFINNELYFYYQRSGSTIHNYTTKVVDDILKNIFEQEHYVINTYPEMIDCFRIYKLLMLSHSYSALIKANGSAARKNSLYLDLKNSFTVRNWIKQKKIKDKVRIMLSLMRLYR